MYVLKQQVKNSSIQIMFAIPYLHSATYFLPRVTISITSPLVTLIIKGPCFVAHTTEAIESISTRRSSSSQQSSNHQLEMASSVMASVSLKPAPFTAERSSVRGLPSLARTPSSFRVVASAKKLKTDKPYGQEPILKSKYIDISITLFNNSQFCFFFFLCE